jgi:type VI secretion system protein VasG
VIGQQHGLDMIAQAHQTSRARLDNPNKPIGVFMLCGTSGVGKTETALALAEALYGGEQNVITINMSEFQEAHTVSSLKGAPPGYVGYGEGGILTEAGAAASLQRRPPRRGGEGPPRRARALLPGVRQGAAWRTAKAG